MSRVGTWLRPERLGWYQQLEPTLILLLAVPRNRSSTTQRLWEWCAVPSIFYVVKDMVVSKATIKELDLGLGCWIYLAGPEIHLLVNIGFTDIGPMPIKHRTVAKPLGYLQVLGNWNNVSSPGRCEITLSGRFKKFKKIRLGSKLLLSLIYGSGFRI